MKILILTPIQVEHEAVLSHLSNSSEVIVEGNRYVIGHFTGESHTFEIVTRQTGSGDSIIAIATERAVKRFNPVVVLLVGVAGGVKDVDIGDIVIGTKYYGFEQGLATDEGIKARPWSSHYSKPMQELAKSVAARKEWRERLQGRQTPKVVFGAIGSSNKVVTGVHSELYHRIKEQYNDTTALEMEAAGFGEAMSAYPTIYALNLRGVSDLIEDKRHSDKAGYQKMAAANVAAFAFELINRLTPAHFRSEETEIRNQLDDLLELLELPKKSIAPVKKEEKYPLPPNRAPRELERLQPLSKEDREYISVALDQLGNKGKANKLKAKLDSLYNFQQLGLRALRRPAIERYERLDKAKVEKKQVILQQYRSNSNDIRDRNVEPFFIDADLDTLQAFDLDAEQNRHFRLSRIQRVLISDNPWRFERRHIRKQTDIFRIADNEPVFVQLRLDVMAYNLLMDAYPKARNETFPGAEPNTFDFEAMVNHNFYGLINFIMGNADHIEVLGPESLKQRMREESEKILKKLET